jgi:hypothetical protein
MPKTAAATPKMRLAIRRANAELDDLVASCLSEIDANNPILDANLLQHIDDVLGKVRYLLSSEPPSARFAKLGTSSAREVVGTLILAKQSLENLNYRTH